MEVSLTDLPPNILSDILSRLPIKSLLASRCVCKSFRDITSSNPYFNSLRSSKTDQILIIQLGNLFKPERLVHLVDSGLDPAFGFGQEVKLKPMFQIPKYPGKYFEKYQVFDGDKNGFVLVNSCNGLLYFAERNLWERSFFCNPITNEYATLLDFDEERNEQQLTLGLWFGFSPRENQYKVLKIFSTVTGGPGEGGFKQEFWAQIHVVGSSSWRDLEDGPPSTYLTSDSCSALLNGTVYWLCRCQEISKFILFFDFEKEKFGEIQPPLDFGTGWRRYIRYMSIGVLGGCLCVTVNTQHLDIWVVEKYESESSWTKKFAIDNTIHMGNLIRVPLKPLKIFSDGKILMMSLDYVLVCYDPEEKNFRVVEFDEFESICMSALFTPSFVPLKEALMVDNLTVQNMT